MDNATDLRIRTGFTELDRYLDGGLGAGSLTVIAGPTGSGSSVLALQLAREAAATQQLSATYLTLDLSVTDVLHRAVMAHTGVRSEQVGLRGRDAHKAKLDRLLDGLLAVESPVSRAAGDVLSAVWQRAVVDERRLVVVDSVNLVGVCADEDTGYDYPSPSLDSPETADFLRRLKVIARDTSMAIVVTVDLPMLGPRTFHNDEYASMAHLHQMRHATQVADNVVLVYRPDLWERNTPRAGEVDFQIRGARANPQTITAAHQLHLSRFFDLSPIVAEDQFSAGVSPDDRVTADGDREGGEFDEVEPLRPGQVLGLLGHVLGARAVDAADG